MSTRLTSCLTVFAALSAPVRSQDVWLEVATPFQVGTAKAATDTNRGCVVVVNATRTLEWHGDHWVERDTPTPVPFRTGIGLAYHESEAHTVLFGGSVSGSHPNDTWTYEGDTWRVQPTTTQPVGRRFLAMAHDPNRSRTVMFGGWNGGYLNDTWEWDGSAWNQIVPATSPSPRWQHGMAWDPATQRVLMYGGESAAGRLSDSWAWDGNDWVLLSPATSPPPEEEFLMASDPIRGIVVVYLRGPGGFLDLETWTWNGLDWSQAPTTNGPNSPRFSMAAFDIHSGSVIAGFGASGTTARSMDTLAFDGVDWTPVDTFPNTSASTLVTDDARGVVVMYSEMLIDDFPMWEWDGRRWQARTSVVDPPNRRSGPGLSFDQARGVTVLFGGSTLFAGVIHDDTWEWNGVDWTQRSPATSPSPRRPLGMVYDPVRNESVLYGGSGSTGNLQDTWLWDGNDWVEAFPATTPPPFNVGAMVWDDARQVVVMVGSVASGPDQTWEWDGTDWTQSNTTNHPQIPTSSTQPFVYDRNRHLVVHRTGNEIWTYDGSDWTLEQTIAAPGFNGLAWDSVHERVIGVESSDGDVWVFGPPVPATANRFGSGCAGTQGIPSLSPRDLPSVMRPDFAFEVVRGRASAPAALQFGIGGTGSAIPFGSCMLLAATPGSFSAPLVLNAGGFAELAVTFPTDTGLFAVDLLAQALILDPLGGGLGVVAMTNGVQFTPGY